MIQHASTARDRSIIANIPACPTCPKRSQKQSESDTDFKAAEGQPLGSEIAITCFLLLPTNLSREMRLPFMFHSSQLAEHTKANLPEN